MIFNIDEAYSCGILQKKKIKSTPSCKMEKLSFLHLIRKKTGLSITKTDDILKKIIENFGYKTTDGVLFYEKRI